MGRKVDKGFTLPEVLIGSAVLMVLFGAVAVMVQATADIIGGAQVKSLATVLVQGKLEIARNMSYGDVGVVGGIPNGVIEPTETVTVNGLDYVVTTNVVYIDDPFDDVTPTDLYANDYKRVRISVSWGGVFPSVDPVVMWTDIAPKGLESDEGGGTISIRVIDALGAAVAGADVTIDADSLLPPVNIQTTTDSDGYVILPGSPECTECYEVTATKVGHTSDRTYGVSEVANPANPHLSVIEDELTQATFVIDLTSTVTYKATRGAANNYAPFQGVQMRVYGSKEIGRTALDEPVYKYDQQIVTGFGGLVVVGGMEWDTYTVEIPSGSSVDFAGSWPFSPFSLLPNTSAMFQVVVEAVATNTLLVQVMDNLQSPIASSSVTLQNDSVAYIATKSSALLDKPDKAQAFFSGLPTTLDPYTILVSSLGFGDEMSVATVSGDVVEQLLMSPL